MNVVPVTSDGDGEDKNNDYDEADILQPSVRRRTTRAATLAVVQWFDHGAIVIEEMPLGGRLRGTTMSTRRLLARPSAVALLAIGRYSA